MKKPRFGLFKIPAACVFSFLFLPVLASSGASTNRMESVSVSPDGKTIAVDVVKDQKSHIYLVSVSTGDAARLTHTNTGEESNLNFSPDGKHVAYTFFPEHGSPSRIVIGNADGSELHEWPRSQDKVTDFSPVFSPDGKTVIFSRSNFYGSYSPIAQPHAHAWDFYAADLDGTNLRQLTNESFYSSSALSISPDGKSMVVVTEEVDTPQQIAIYSLDHADKPARVFRPHVPGEPGHEGIYNCPNFLPDGKSVLFMAASEGRHGFDYDVYRMELGTGALERLTKGNGYATDLKVSANGKTAAFLKWRSDWHGTPVTNELYLLDLQTLSVTLLNISGLN